MLKLQTLEPLELACREKFLNLLYDLKDIPSNVVLPNSKNGKPVGLQFPIDPQIPLLIAGNFLRPIISVFLRESAMGRTPVPEATVYEDDQFLSRKAKVRSTRQFRVFPISSQSLFPKILAEQ